MSRSALRLLLVCAAVCVAARPAHARTAACVRIPEGRPLTVSASTTVCAGVYEVADGSMNGVIIVNGDDVTLDLTGVTLRGVGFVGFGVRAINRNGLKVIAGAISGFTAAVYITGGSGHTIRNGNHSHNRLRAVTNTTADFLDIWPDLSGQFKEDQVGNGVLLHRVRDSVVEGNTLVWQQNGIGLYECSGIRVLRNDVSNVEGWAISLSKTTRSFIELNRGDHAHPKRSTYCRDVQDNGCDSAGLLVIKASNDNVVTRNSFVDGGDGIFSGAQSPTRWWGAERNIYTYNNVSLARAIGLEWTFGHDNVFIGNIANHCLRYGAWLGFSIGGVLRQNSFVGNAWAGVSNQNAQNCTIEGNLIVNNTIGIDANMAPWPKPRLSTGYHIRGNIISGSTKVGLSLVDTADVTAEGNTISANGGGNVLVAVTAQTKGLGVRGPLNVRGNNIMLADTVYAGAAKKAPWNVDNEQASAVDLTGNYWATANVSGTLRGEASMARAPAAAVALLRLTYKAKGGGAPVTLVRAVNARTDDADDNGNAGATLGVGAAGIVGLRFRDIYVPAGATIVQAQLELPLAAGVKSQQSAVNVFASAEADAKTFAVPAWQPSTRAHGSETVLWYVEATAAGQRVVSPDLKAIFIAWMLQSGWASGNSIALLLEVLQGSEGFTLTSYDSQAHDAFSASPVAPAFPWQHYASHRFAKFIVHFTLSSGEAMVMVSELAAGVDNADNIEADPANVQFGRVWPNKPSFTAGFRFTNLQLPADANLLSAYMWLPTDGPYSDPIAVSIGAAVVNDTGDFSSSLPAARTLYKVSVPWDITDAWSFHEWHRSPDLLPLLAQYVADGSWSDSGNAVVFTLACTGNCTATRRVWAFRRDPRTSEHDFVDAGATPFTPMKQAPVNVVVRVGPPPGHMPPPYRPYRHVERA